MAEKTEKKARILSQERIRIKLRSYDHRMLDNSVARIVETAQKTGAIVAGPVLLYGTLAGSVYGVIYFLFSWF